MVCAATLLVSPSYHSATNNLCKRIINRTSQVFLVRPLLNCELVAEVHTGRFTWQRENLSAKRSRNRARCIENWACHRTRKYPSQNLERQRKKATPNSPSARDLP